MHFHLNNLFLRFCSCIRRNWVWPLWVWITWMPLRLWHLKLGVYEMQLLLGWVPLNLFVCMCCNKKWRSKKTCPAKKKLRAQKTLVRHLFGDLSRPIAPWTPNSIIRWFPSDSLGVVRLICGQMNRLPGRPPHQTKLLYFITIIHCFDYILQLFCFSYVL